MKKFFTILAVVFAAISLSGCSKYFSGENDPYLIGTWVGQGTIRTETGEIVKKATYYVTFTSSQIQIIIEDTSSNTHEYVSGVAANNEKYFTVKASENYSMFYTIENDCLHIIGSDNQYAIWCWPVYLGRYIEPQQ